MSTEENFGAFIRRKREAKQIGLRQMAKLVGVSPTYLSRVERDELAPPVEDKVIAIARIIEWDADDLLARANRLPADVVDIIKRRPAAWTELVRSTEDMQARLVIERFLLSWKAPRETRRAMSVRGIEDAQVREVIERFLRVWGALVPGEKDLLHDEDTARTDEDRSATLAR